MHDRLNIVLLTIDSLRADHLGCYGYPLPTSPFVDSFAGQGVLAERFMATAIPTHPSYTTLLTGQYPTTHNIVSHGGKAEPVRDVTNVAEEFLRAGYATCLVDNLWRQRYWFGRGFEFIIDPSARRNQLLTIDSADLNRRAVPWIREHADEPFFLFMHYWDPHYPYVSRPDYREQFYQGNPVDPANHSLEPWWDHPIGSIAQATWLRTAQGVVTDAEYVRALYDQEIRHLDDALRDIVSTVDELGLAAQTLIVIIADHGESMTEHGIFFDHYGLYDTVLHVPMVMRLEGRLPADRRLTPQLQHVDIGPTLLDAAGLDVPPAMEGRSFWKLATGETETGGHDAIVSLESTWQSCWSLRTDHYKFILARDPDENDVYPRELYDLAADPGEEHNLVDERPEVARELEERLEAWIADRLQAAGRQEDPLREQGSSMRMMLIENG